jgi:hypothetical protein
MPDTSIALISMRCTQGTRARGATGEEEEGEVKR